jgi:hypothetical protein
MGMFGSGNSNPLPIEAMMPSGSRSHTCRQKQADSRSQNVPKIEVDHGPVEGKSLSEMLKDMTREFEAEKFKPVLI